MTRRSITQRLEQLDAQKKTLQSRLGKQARARDTRRKVLLGALILHRLEFNKPDISATWLRTWLSTELLAFLTRDMDKTLLADLISVPAPGPIAAPQTASMPEPVVLKLLLETA